MIDELLPVNSQDVNIPFGIILPANFKRQFY
jgi:hypothetical protein